MSSCEDCNHNSAGYVTCSCEYSLEQVRTARGVRSKILACPKYLHRPTFDYQPRDQAGGVLQ